MLFRSVRVDYRRTLGPVDLVAFVDVVNVIGTGANTLEFDPRRGENVLEEFDAFTVYAEGGEEGLRGRLEGFDLISLKKILNRHDFDPSRFAQKWKDKSRLIDLILKRVAARTNGKEEKL